jgi:hypothetical protein
MRVDAVRVVVVPDWNKSPTIGRIDAALADGRAFRADPAKARRPRQ